MTSPARGLTHIGFKDVGLRRAEMHVLVQRIREIGAGAYLEVVSLDAAEELQSIRTGLDLGVDWLLGGTMSKRHWMFCAERRCAIALSRTGGGSSQRPARAYVGHRGIGQGSGGPAFTAWICLPTVMTGTYQPSPLT
jgi:hypothetical protein